MIPIGWLIAAMALQAAGSYTQHRAQQAALRRQGELAAAASRFQGEIGKKGQRALNQQVEQYGADERGEGLQQQEEDLTGYLSSPWGEDSTTLPAPAQTGGNVSAKFTRDVALASAAELEGARAAAPRLAKHMAPTYLRTQEGYGVADLASSLGMLRSIAVFLAQSGDSCFWARRCGVSAAWRNGAGTGRSDPRVDQPQQPGCGQFVLR